MWRGLFWRKGVSYREEERRRAGGQQKLTFRPITPRQAIEGIAVAMALPARSGLCRHGVGMFSGDFRR